MQRNSEAQAVTGEIVPIKIEEQEYVWREPPSEKLLLAMKLSQGDRLWEWWGKPLPTTESHKNTEPVVRPEPVVLKPLEFTEEESSRLLASEPAAWLNTRERRRRLKGKARSGGSTHRSIEISTEPTVGATNDEDLISGEELFDVWVPQNWGSLIESSDKSGM
ncbi:hypothetical protein FRC12_019119 [Ceratobasidium sp. 428]|nr:hypothetical protein FRC12_019119 [Ceratobasidium sp. 428]